MLFHTTDFLLFLTCVIVAFAASPVRFRWAVLLGASVCFYGAGEPVFLLQIVAATAFTFWLAQRIEASAEKQRRRPLVSAGIVVLTLNLVGFKYSAFLNESMRDLLAVVHVEYGVPQFEALLPLGLSFYTFQLIGYLVDVYRGQSAERHAGVFALFVLFFPKLIAGPIERARHLLPQLHRVHTFQYARVVGGLRLILWGAFKKVVVADRIAPLVALVYDDPGVVDGALTTLATGLYAFQIYCDFSGYTDMAMGLAALFGYSLAQNFNRPYVATSIQDFWKRWHISLSSWLTDYIYTPLTRQKRVKIKYYTLMLVGLFVTFVISGFWHGAQWTYVAWGALHGTYIVLSLQTQKWRGRVNKAIGLTSHPRLHRGLRIAVTFSLVCLAYILFRAESLSAASRLLGSLVTGWTGSAQSVRAFVFASLATFQLASLGILAVLLAEYLFAKPSIRVFVARSTPVRWSLYLAGGVAIAALGAFYDQDQKFIYFRF